MMPSSTENTIHHTLKCVTIPHSSSFDSLISRKNRLIQPKNNRDETLVLCNLHETLLVVLSVCTGNSISHALLCADLISETSQAIPNQALTHNLTTLFKPLFPLSLSLIGNRKSLLSLRKTVVRWSWLVMIPKYGSLAFSKHFAFTTYCGVLGWFSSPLPVPPFHPGRGEPGCNDIYPPPIYTTLHLKKNGRMDGRTDVAASSPESEEKRQQQYLVALNAACVSSSH